MPNQVQQDSVLQQLKKKEAEFKEKMKEAQKKIAKREVELRNKRAMILGKAVLTEIEQNKEMLRTITPIIEKHVKADKDRKILGLEIAENDNLPLQDQSSDEK